jgi:hypothetical protein
VRIKGRVAIQRADCGNLGTKDSLSGLNIVAGVLETYLLGFQCFRRCLHSL